MLKDFRAYQLSVQFYKVCEKVRGPIHLRDQLLRSSSSITLNLAEGSEGASLQNRRRFYRIAMGSLRESQAILDLMPESELQANAARLGQTLGGYVFRLCQVLNAHPGPSPES